MIKRKIEYSILSSQDMFILSMEVKRMIEDGWEPQGGIAALAFPIFNPDGSSQYVKEYTQAMVRIELPLTEFVGSVLYSEQQDPYAKESSQG